MFQQEKGLQHITKRWSLTLLDAHNILSYNDWNIDKNILACDRRADIKVAIGVVIETIENIIKRGNGVRYNIQPRLL